MDELLVEWLRAQLDEDERIAREADDSLGKMNLDWRYQSEDGLGGKVVSARGADIIYDVAVGVGEHVSAHGPRRVLAEIAAKRQVIAKFTAAVERMAELAALIERLKTDGMDTFMPEMDRATAIHRRDVLYQVLQLHALPYADRPGYLEEWRP